MADLLSVVLTSIVSLTLTVFSLVWYKEVWKYPVRIKITTIVS